MKKSYTVPVVDLFAGDELFTLINSGEYTEGDGMSIRWGGYDNNLDSFLGE